MYTYKRLWPGKICWFPWEDSKLKPNVDFFIWISRRSSIWCYTRIFPFKPSSCRQHSDEGHEAGLHMTLHSIYLPPHNLNTDDFGDPFRELPHLILLSADFNDRHHLWRDTLCSHRGCALEYLFCRVDAVFLNCDTHILPNSNWDIIQYRSVSRYWRITE